MNTSVEKLIETTQALLWERGYVGMSPRAIQDAAGVGQGSMYHHFRSKAALALAAEERSAQTVIAEMAALLDSPPQDPIARLMAFLRMERQVLRGCRLGRLTADPEVVSDEALRRPLEQAFGWMVERLRALLQEAQDIGALDPQLSPARVATTIVATRQGAYVLARAANSTAPYEEAIEGLISLLDGYRRQGATRPVKRRHT